MVYVKLNIVGRWYPTLPIKISSVTGHPSIKLLPERYPTEYPQRKWYSTDYGKPVYLILDSRGKAYGKKTAEFMIAKPLPPCLISYENGKPYIKPTYGLPKALKRFASGSEYAYISSLYPASETQASETQVAETYFTFDYERENYVMTTDYDTDGHLIYVISKT